jgi:hypothetical protein
MTMHHLILPHVATHDDGVRVDDPAVMYARCLCSCGRALRVATRVNWGAETGAVWRRAGGESHLIILCSL